METEGPKIEYRTQSRLFDSLKVHFRSSFHVLRYCWMLYPIIVVVLLSLHALSLWDDPGLILVPMIAGLAGGTLAGPAVLIARRLFRKSPEIKADIGDQGIKVFGQHGFNYEMSWPNLTWIREGSSAYVLRFNKLFLRLPKRGFVGQQESAFREVVRAQAPVSALKWKTTA